MYRVTLHRQQALAQDVGHVADRGAVVQNVRRHGLSKAEIDGRRVALIGADAVRGCVDGEALQVAEIVGGPQRSARPLPISSVAVPRSVRRAPMPASRRSTLNMTVPC